MLFLNLSNRLVVNSNEIIVCPEDLRNVMSISAGYATGSSGGSVMDQFGNIVGTVSNTRTLLHSDMNPSLQMVIKNTIPVESLRLLIAN